MNKFNLKIKLNIEYSLATELYDEIEGYLALCFEEIIQRKPLNIKGLSDNFINNDLISIDKLAQIITPTVLTGFLSEKLKNRDIKVEKVEIYLDGFDYSTNINVYIFAPNLWASKFGKETNINLNSILEFFKKEYHEQIIQSSQHQTVTEDYSTFDNQQTMFNGMLVRPLIGSIYYDQLSHTMKYWNGTVWHTL